MSSHIANKIKINLHLVLIKILYYSHNSACHCLQLYVNNNNYFVCYYSVYTLWINNNNCQTIVRQIFVTAFFKPQLLSTTTSHLHTRMTELLLSHSPALPCLLYGNVNSLINNIEVQCLLFVGIFFLHSELLLHLEAIESRVLVKEANTVPTKLQRLDHYQFVSSTPNRQRCCSNIDRLDLVFLLSIAYGQVSQATSARF